MFSEIHCIVSGAVQQVAYRDFVQRSAQNLGLYGWVRNKEDESVEILAQGIPDELKQFIELLNEGSSLSRVDSVSVDWRTAKNQLDDFVVLY